MKGLFVKNKSLKIIAAALLSVCSLNAGYERYKIIRDFAETEFQKIEAYAVFRKNKAVCTVTQFIDKRNDTITYDISKQDTDLWPKDIFGLDEKDIAVGYHATRNLFMLFISLCEEK